MVFDFRKLRGRIIEVFGSYAGLAKALNMSPAQLSDRLNNRISFKPDEIYTIASPEVLNIPSEEIPRYFLTPLV